MMASDKQPIFVLVPGAFCLATVYERLIEVLKRNGHESITVSLPTVGKDFQNAHERAATAYDDSDRVNEIAAAYCDKGRDVVLVGNSYGGFVITEAAKGLCRSEREATGKTGGALLGLVFLSSLVSTMGNSVTDLVAGKQPIPTGGKTDELLDPAPPEIGGAIMCSTLTTEEQIRYGSMVDVFSAEAFSRKITYAGHEHVPSIYVVGTEDKMIAPENYYESIDEWTSKQPNMIQKIVLDGADHLMMVSQADKVAEISITAAKRWSGTQ